MIGRLCKRKVISMVDKNSGAIAIFLCDGKACPEDKKTNCFTQRPEERERNRITNALCDPCRHTSDVSHAVNFQEFAEESNAYVEKITTEEKEK